MNAVPPWVMTTAGILLILGMIPVLRVDISVVVPMAGGLLGVWLVFKAHERRQALRNRDADEQQREG
jgi:Flp pilus assembly protein TadB